MITIDDIAKQAGVSVSTVSRALSGSSLVNDATRDRIRALADQNGYKVNRVARNLATKTSNLLGLVVPDVLNPYFPKLIDTVVRKAKRAGYLIVPALSGSEQEDEVACLQMLDEMRADGVILVTGKNGMVAGKTAQELQNRGTRVVVLGWDEGTDQFDNVFGDDIAGAALMTRHLLDLGHRNICFLAEVIERGSHDRIHGFIQEMKAAGLDPDAHIVTGIETEEALREVVLSQLPGKTAFFAYHDMLAAQVLRVLQDANVSVPTQCSVVGFDNLDLGQYVQPRLTTIDISIEAHAAKALKILFDDLGGNRSEAVPTSAVIEPQLIIRESSGIAPHLA